MRNVTSFLARTKGIAKAELKTDSIASYNTNTRFPFIYKTLFNKVFLVKNNIINIGNDSTSKKSKNAVSNVIIESFLPVPSQNYHEEMKKLIPFEDKTCKAPDLPTVCCGSGCQECVWLIYAREIEEYRKKAGYIKALNEINKIPDEALKAFMKMELNFC
ncbi:unnamed protein product [Gordionus sp. m RMFG-2023]